MKPFNSILSASKPSIFEEMNRLALANGALNLGQGAPDEEGPLPLREAAATALLEGSNQYPPLLGTARLRQAIAGHEQRFYDIEVNWEDQILVTAGASEALAAAIFALVEAGDEVVLFEPLYDCYLPLVKLAGGVAKIVRLNPPDWELDAQTLEDAFSARTKLVILNNPMNPAAKVFSQSELALIARLTVKHDAYALCDEVYEHMVFGEGAHLPLMNFPGMGARSLRVASIGKTFSFTGWKVGYVVGDAPLIDVISRAHQCLVFTVPPNLQTACADGLGLEDKVFEDMRWELAEKKELLAAGLKKAGFRVLSGAGSYFINADIRGLEGFADGQGDDIAFCRHMAQTAKVSAIPVSPFYVSGADETAVLNRGGADAPRHLVRFCFARSLATLEEGAARLARQYGG